VIFFYFVLALRGTGGGVLILEEAAYINPTLFKRVIIPLMLMDKVVVIGISSPSGETNYCSQLVNCRRPDTGDLIFNTISIGLTCDDCIKWNPGEECDHVFKMLPDHRSEKNLTITKALLANDEDATKQELEGKVDSSTPFPLKKDIALFIKRNETKPAYRFQEKVQVLHSAIDPSGGGQQSDWTIITIARESGQYIIVGIDHYDKNKLTGDSIMILKTMLYNHYDQLFKNPMFEDAIVRVYMEVSSDHITPQIWPKFLNNYAFPNQNRFYFPSNQKDNRLGIKTDDKQKQQWTQNMQEMFSSGLIHYHYSIVTTTTNKQVELKAKLEDQLMRWSKSVTPFKDVYNKARVTYGAKGGGLKDDLACALGIVLTQTRLAGYDDFYKEFCEKMNISRI
jgi:hypothetical protein